MFFESIDVVCLLNSSQAEGSRSTAGSCFLFSPCIFFVSSRKTKINLFQIYPHPLYPKTLLVYGIRYHPWLNVIISYEVKNSGVNAKKKKHSKKQDFVDNQLRKFILKLTE